MFVQDKIADMLTRIRNANIMRYPTVEVIGTKMTLGIAEILKREGYIEEYNYEKTVLYAAGTGHGSGYGSLCRRSQRNCGNPKGRRKQGYLRRGCCRLQGRFLR